MIYSLEAALKILNLPEDVQAQLCYVLKDIVTRPGQMDFERDRDTINIYINTGKYTGRLTVYNGVYVKGQLTQKGITQAIIVNENVIFSRFMMSKNSDEIINGLYELMVAAGETRVLYYDKETLDYIIQQGQQGEYMQLYYSVRAPLREIGVLPDFEHVIGESDLPLPQDPVQFVDMVRRLREEKDQDSAPGL